MLHRDVKPANILITRFGEPALADFGLAVLTETRESSITLELTPAYAAPEMFHHGRPVPASDVYGLCATLYALMRGRPPRWRENHNPTLVSLVDMFAEPVPDLPGRAGRADRAAAPGHGQRAAARARPRPSSATSSSGFHRDPDPTMILRPVTGYPVREFTLPEFPMREIPPAPEPRKPDRAEATTQRSPARRSAEPRPRPRRLDRGAPSAATGDDGRVASTAEPARATRAQLSRTCPGPGGVGPRS